MNILKRKDFQTCQWEHDIQDHMHAFVISCSIYFNVNTRSQCLVVYSALGSYGVGMAGVGLSVMHDANHGAYSKSPLVNNIIGKVLVLLGETTRTGESRQRTTSHTYTNVNNMDEDIAPPPFILRFSPHTKRLKIHRFQHVYAYFFYGLMTMMWFISKDYQQAKRYHEMDLVKTQGSYHPKTCNQYHI